MHITRIVASKGTVDCRTQQVNNRDNTYFSDPTLPPFIFTGEQRAPFGVIQEAQGKASTLKEAFIVRSQVGDPGKVNGQLRSLCLALLVLQSVVG